MEEESYSTHGKSYDSILDSPSPTSGGKVMSNRSREEVSQEFIEKGMRELQELLQPHLTNKEFLGDTLNYYLAYMDKYLFNKRVDIDRERKEIFDTLTRKEMPEFLKNSTAEIVLGKAEAIAKKWIEVVDDYFYKIPTVEIESMLSNMGFKSNMLSSSEEELKSEEIKNHAKTYFYGLIGEGLAGGKDTYWQQLLTKRDESDAKLLTSDYNRYQLLNDKPGGHQGKEIERRVRQLAEKELEKLRGEDSHVLPPL